mmetsp:Transcript_7745/g.17951  ORF Transcript_7745/g.17951 Transcript_7745/m.17951 type:complete len:222 (+) Transcript_7745:2314-2979(+)
MVIDPAAVHDGSALHLSGLSRLVRQLPEMVSHLINALVDLCLSLWMRSQLHVQGVELHDKVVENLLLVVCRRQELDKISSHGGEVKQDARVLLPHHPQALAARRVEHTLRVLPLRLQQRRDLGMDLLARRGRGRRLALLLLLRLLAALGGFPTLAARGSGRSGWRGLVACGGWGSLAAVGGLGGGRAWGVLEAGCFGRGAGANGEASSTGGPVLGSQGSGT